MHRSFKKVILHFYWVPIFLMFNTFSPVAQEVKYWHIKSEHYSCLMKNLREYEATKLDQVVIFLSACPETDLLKIFNKSSKNQSVLDVNPVEDSRFLPAEVITFTKTQLGCLRTRKFEKEGAVIQIPRNPCE